MAAGLQVQILEKVEKKQMVNLGDSLLRGGACSSPAAAVSGLGRRAFGARSPQWVAPHTLKVLRPVSAQSPV